MEITWYGLSCFKLVERGIASVVTDPYDHQATSRKALHLSADIVTISHNDPGHNFLDAVKGTPYIVRGPGEYEVGGVFITGIQTGGTKSSEEAGSPTNYNTLYVFDFDPLTVAHLGDLSRIPTQAEVEAIGTVNVALVPIGGNHSLTPARAAEVISLLEPNIVVPMQYDTPGGGSPLDSLSKFLKEMGLSEVQTQTSLKVTSNNLPEETQVIVLETQGT
jgi:L-ascorbate metabolism protein UlaG (beta-lactamase superfamily)